MATVEIGAVIQARTGSTRLPKKVLRDILGKPMILQIFKQLSQVSGLERIALSTSDQSSDDALCEYAKNAGMEITRGPVDDLITRLTGAQQVLECDYLIRVWGDCPLICPDIIENMLSRIQKNNLHFISNCEPLKRTLPAGLDAEIYNKEALDYLNLEITDASSREFPMEGIRSGPTWIKWDVYSPKCILQDVHLTVDYEEDLKAMEQIYKMIYQKDEPITLSKLEKLFETHPDLLLSFSSKERNKEYKKVLRQKGMIYD